MNRPFDDDPFSHAPTEEISYPVRSRVAETSGVSRQPSSPGFLSQGLASQTGLVSQSDQTVKRLPGQPGIPSSTSSPVQDPLNQPGLSHDDQSDEETMPQLDFPPLVDPFAPEVVNQPDPAPQNNDLSQTWTKNGVSPAQVAEQPTTILSSVQPTPLPMSQATSSTVQSTTSPRPEADLPTAPLAVVQPTPPPTPKPATLQPLQLPTPRKTSKKSGVLVSVVVILALLVAGGGTFFALHLRSVVQSNGKQTAQVSPTASSITPTVTTTGTLKQPLQVGENWVVTVTKVSTTTTSAFPPQAGYTYLEISLSLKNVSANPQMLASLLQFTFTDANGKKYNEAQALQYDSNIQQTPDGTVNSGQTLKAQLSYLVPKTQHTFTLSFEYDLIQGGSSAVTWLVNV